MKVEYIREKRDEVKEDSDRSIFGLKLIAESDLEQGLLKEFHNVGVEVHSKDVGWASLWFVFRSLKKPREYPHTKDYNTYPVKVHKDWLPMLQAMQEAGSFGTKKLKIEHILDGLLLRKLQDARDALTDIMLEVNAPKAEEE